MVSLLPKIGKKEDKFLMGDSAINKAIYSPLLFCKADPPPKRVIRVPVVVECLQCHEKVMRYPSQLREHTFCNRKCKGKWWSEHIIGKKHPKFKDSDVLCSYCNKVFHVKYNTLTKRKNHFCNRDCWKKWLDENKRHEVKCDYCKSSIIIPSNQLKGSKNHFCNEECYARWQSKNRMRENNPNYKSVKTSCSWCNKVLYRQPCILRNHKTSFCNKKCHDNWQREFKNKLWENPEYVKNVMKGLNAKPNKAEKLLDKLIQKHFPDQWKFIGDGKEGITIGGRLSDWIYIGDGKRNVIELFGEPFHSNLHAPSMRISYHRTYQGTIEHYKRYGYDCLVIWYKELKDKKKVIEKIHGFTHHT